MELSKQVILDSLWVEKYRPKELTDMALDPSHREKFGEYIMTQVIPNILLAGPAGSGKTTIAKILLSKLNCDFEFLNASDERGIDVIRGKVKNFAKMATFKGLKVLLMDEFDAVTPEAQAALRATMEQYAKSTRFILTCNYPNRIIDPIQSRCQLFVFNAFPKDEMKKILVRILTEEKMTFDDKELDKHIAVYYPDLRRAINMMQQGIRSGRFIFKDKQDLNARVIELILKKDLKEIRKELATNAPDYPELYRYVYDNIYLFPEEARLQILLDAAEYLWRDNSVPDQEMNFAAFCIQVFKQAGKKK